MMHAIQKRVARPILPMLPSSYGPGMPYSRGGRHRPHIATAIIVAILLGCASACSAIGSSEEGLVSEHAEALRVAAEGCFAAQDLVKSASGETQPGLGDVVVTISVEPETSVEALLELLDDAEAALADQIAVDPLVRFSVTVWWTVQGTVITWWTGLGPDVDRAVDRPKLDFAVGRAGPTAETVQISSYGVQVSRGAYEQFPEELETVAPDGLPSGSNYGQTATVHGWFVSLSLKAGCDVSAVPLAELTTEEPGSQAGNIGSIAVSTLMDGGVRLEVDGIAGGLEPASTTGILSVMDSCAGVVDSLVLSSRSEHAPGLAAFSCSGGGLTPDKSYYEPTNNPTLAAELLREARSGR